MKVFAFDLLPYPENLDHLKQGGPELPYPLPKSHFLPEVAVRNYEEHLDAWAFMEDIGFDGVGFNEHHTSPYGLMTSPNLMAAAASQRTKLPHPWEPFTHPRALAPGGRAVNAGWHV